MTADPTGAPTNQGALDSTMVAIARSGTFNLAGSAVAALCQFLVVLIATRFYTAADAGALFAATAAFVIVVALAQLGADEALVRFLSAARARGAADDAHRILVIGLVPVAVTSVVAGGLLFALARPVAGLFAADQQLLVEQMLHVLALTVPFAAAHEAMLAATRGYGRIRPTVMVERVVRAALQPIALLAVGLAGLGPEAMAPAWAAPYLVGVVLSAVALRRTAAVGVPGPRTGDAVAAEPPGRSTAHTFWAFCSTRFLARVCQVALHRLDVILVATLVGTREAAIYTAATRFIALGQLVNLAIGQVIQPRLAGMLALRQTRAAEAVVRQATVWLVMLTWPGYLALVVLAPWLMPLFGAGYDSGAPVLALLAAAMMVATAAGPVDVVLVMAGRGALSLANTATALVVDVVGCLLLVPRFGIMGAAAAWAAAVVIRNALSVMQTRRLLSLSAASRQLGYVALLAVACFAALPLPLVLLGTPLVGLVLVISGGLVAYAVANWRWRAATGLHAFAGLLERRATTTAVVNG